MEEIYIPRLHAFAMENTFTGSSGNLRFRAVPRVTTNGKEVDFANSSIFVEYWRGPFCYEKSQMEGSAEFPLTEEGRLAMKAWLESNI